MNAIAFEWMKLRTVRSTYIALAVAAVAVAAGAAWAWNVANLYDGRPIDDKISTAASAEYLVIQILPICLGVLGVLTITSEHATGMINSTLIAVPRRLAVLGSKIFIVAATAFVVSLLCLLGALLAGRGLVGNRPIAGYTGALTDQLPLVFASAALVAVTAVVGLSLGAIVRSTAGAVVALTTLLFVLPGLTRLLPAPWSDRVNALLLPSLPEELSGTGGVLEPVVAAGVLATYAIVTITIAALSLTRRDT